MELQLVSFEQAKKLKELGFDWEVLSMYNKDGEIIPISQNEIELRFGNANDCINTFSAPTVALALKWFRDIKHKIFEIGITQLSPVIDKMTHNILFYEENCYYTWIHAIGKGDGVIYKKYDEAEKKVLDELLSIELKETRCVVIDIN